MVKKKEYASILNFAYIVFLEMRGSMEMDGHSETFTPENSLLRGCRLKNTTFVEGIVIYAG